MGCKLELQQPCLEVPRQVTCCLGTRVLSSRSSFWWLSGILCTCEQKEEPQQQAEEKPAAAAATATAEKPPPPLEASAKPAPPPPPPAAPQPQKRADGRVIATPYAKKLAKELGVDLASLAGSGPAGRITASDVEATRGNGKGKSKNAHDKAIHSTYKASPMAESRRMAGLLFARRMVKHCPAIDKFVLAILTSSLICHVSHISQVS